MSQDEKRMIISTRYVLEISVSRFDTVEVSSGYGNTKSTRVQQDEIELAEYTITKKQLQDALDKGVKLLELTGE